MTDFSELENQLKGLRPAPASEGLFARVEKSFVDLAHEPDSSGKILRPDRFRFKWLAIGAGLAAAAVILIFARVDFRTPSQTQNVAKVSPAPAVRSTNAAAQFIPAGATQIVYHTRDEGLLFPRGAAEPVRRLRSRTRETLQWQNPATGASLRVSYPSEQVELIPVSGQ
ncbi:MAG: hypothetical protein M3R29_05155 [Verrucomicrobiota bacterium]|nr:hypothetical protein [Verrucomicrobiota bacterium]